MSNEPTDPEASTPNWADLAPLLEQRIVELGGPIDDESAALVIAQLLYLESEDPRSEIELRISSRGGAVTCALTIFETMQSLSPPVRTMAAGNVAGVAVLLLVGGTRGRRVAQPTARIGLVELRTAPGDHTPQLLAEMQRLRDETYALFARHTGCSPDAARRLHQNAATFSAARALSMGLIDRVLDEA